MRYVGQAGRQKPQCTQLRSRSRASRASGESASESAGLACIVAVSEVRVHPARVQDTGRIEDALHCTMQVEQRRRQRREDFAGVVELRRRRDGRGWHGRPRPGDQVDRLSLDSVDPGLRSVPFERDPIGPDQRSARRRRRRRQRESPEWVRRGEVRVGLFANTLPERGGSRLVQQVAADRRYDFIQARRGAFQADVQFACAPETAGEREAALRGSRRAGRSRLARRCAAAASGYHGRPAAP